MWYELSTIKLVLYVDVRILNLFIIIAVLRIIDAHSSSNPVRWKIFWSLDYQH